MACCSSAIFIFDKKDVEIGNLIGEGGFCHVYSASLRLEVEQLMLHRPCLSNNNDQRKNDVLSGSRGSSEETVADDLAFSDEAYVIKRLYRGSLAMRCSRDSDKENQQAADDLVREVQILTCLPTHPNVIGIRGVSSDFYDNPRDGFIVLDRLVETLDETLERRRQAATSGLQWLWNKHLSRESQTRRIKKVILGATSALQFLHAQKYLYRDVKPQNLGFRVNTGRICLFDFGLAKRLPEGADKNGGGGADDYHLTAFVGTLRYMAPEVAASETSYGYPADVYSLGLLLFEVCTLEMPYKHCTGHGERHVLQALVTRKDVTPPTRNIASVAIKKLLEACWDANSRQRPTMEQVYQSLVREVEGS